MLNLIFHFDLLSSLQKWVKKIIVQERFVHIKNLHISIFTEDFYIIIETTLDYNKPRLGRPLLDKRWSFIDAKVKRLIFDLEVFEDSWFSSEGKIYINEAQI